MSEVQSRLVSDAVTKVGTILDEIAPGHLKFDEGKFTVAAGSSQVMVSVRPFTADEVVVEITAHVVFGANVNGELMKWLLRKNAEIHFGAFGLLFDDTVIFSHAVTGAELNDLTLTTSLKAVSVLADHYDDVIVEMAGGKRVADISNLEED